MSFEWIEKNYGLRFARGQLVLAGEGSSAKAGTVTSASNYVHVRLDGWRHSVPFHPTDVKPIADGIQAAVAKARGES